MQYFHPFLAGSVCFILWAERLSGAMDTSWEQIYQAALVELQPGEMRQRIEAAEKAIYQRVEQLKQSKAGSGDELWAIHDALRRLRVLAETENRPPTSPQAVRPKPGAVS